MGNAACSIDAIGLKATARSIVFTDWSGRSPQGTQRDKDYLPTFTVNLQRACQGEGGPLLCPYQFSMIFVILKATSLSASRARVLEDSISQPSRCPRVFALSDDATGVGRCFLVHDRGGGLGAARAALRSKVCALPAEFHCRASASGGGAANAQQYRKSY